MSRRISSGEGRAASYILKTPNSSQHRTLVVLRNRREPGSAVMDSQFKGGRDALSGLSCLLLPSWQSTAQAQTSFVNPNYGGGSTIITPGQPPTFVNPNYGGGYTMTTAGQPPTFVNPNYGGGYTMTTPGQPPTFVNPNYEGGYTMTTPGEPPTFVNPNYGGGATATTPGAATYIHQSKLWRRIHGDHALTDNSDADGFSWLIRGDGHLSRCIPGRQGRCYKTGGSSSPLIIGPVSGCLGSVKEGFVCCRLYAP